MRFLGTARIMSQAVVKEQSSALWQVLGRFSQAATTGSLKIGSSPNGAIVSRIM
jgi:hypothetical protein